MFTIQNNATPLMNINKDINNQENNAQNSSLLRETAGVAAGAGAGFCVSKTANLALKPYIKNLKSFMDEFHKANSGVMLQEAERMAKEACLTQKGFMGIKIFDVSSEARVKQAAKTFLAETHQSFKNGSVIKKITWGSFCIFSKLSEFPYLLIGKIPNIKAKLQNAIIYGGYNPFSNNVISGRTSSLLHEIGHAINKNKNILTAMPGKLAIASTVLLTPLAILTAMFHKKEENNDKTSENKSFVSKTKDFVKEHIGLTVAGLSLPLLAEESIASLRAVKSAKKSTLMTETVKKGHSKLLLMAFGAYVAGAATLTAMAKTAVWVKHKVTGQN